MLADLFYLSSIWLILGFVMLLLLGTRLRHSDFFSSLIYLVILAVAGDLVALGLLGEAPALVAIFTPIVLLGGVLLFLVLRDWNAAGQAFFLFSIVATVTYLLYA